MKAIAILSLLICMNLNAATVAIIDSGLDYKHQYLQGNIWANPNEIEDNRDNDGNGYQDDIYGWSFAEQSPSVIDYSYLNTFTPDVYRYFEYQARYLLGTATESDIQWMKDKRQDKKFMAEMGKFGNFVHGTHVAGIAMKGTNSQAMGLKLIPTEIKPFAEQFIRGQKSADPREQILQALFSALAQQQMNLLEEIALYINDKKVDVANGSFGTGFNQAKMITDTIFKILYFRAPKKEESDKVSHMFMSALLLEGQRMMKAAPNTLFVFAAGNDGSNNDIYPTSPTNIKMPNSISVAATYGTQFLASFSNYGIEMVDVAAPGMIIDSSIPGDLMLKVSGTSQAAPYVANIAARIKEANPSLTPEQIKKILMGSVDKKLFLTDKVKSGGLVNPSRAVFAAELTKSVSVDEALSRSMRSVGDREETLPKISPLKSVEIAPIFPLFI